MGFQVFCILLSLRRECHRCYWRRWQLQERKRGRAVCHLALGQEENRVFTVQGGVHGWKKKLRLFLEQKAQSNSRRSSAALLWSKQERTEVWISTATRTIITNTAVSELNWTRQGSLWRGSCSATKFTGLSHWNRQREPQLGRRQT